MFRKRFIGSASASGYGEPTKRSWRFYRSIRILDPKPSDWFLFARRKGQYYFIPEGGPVDPKARRFSILDVGDLDEPGIQGLAFNRKPLACGCKQGKAAIQSKLLESGVRLEGSFNQIDELSISIKGRKDFKLELY